MNDEIPCNKQNCLGVILAGGEAMRMNGDAKFLHHLGQHSILHIIAQNLRRQTNHIILNAKIHPATIKQIALPIIGDAFTQAKGPMAGIITAMHYAQQSLLQYDWILSVAADTPFFPENLLEKFARKIMENAEDGQMPIVMAISNNRTHPTFCLWPTRITDEVIRLVCEEKIRKIDAITAKFPTLYCAFDDDGDLDPFFNINTYDDLLHAQRHAQSLYEPRID